MSKPSPGGVAHSRRPAAPRTAWIAALVLLGAWTAGEAWLLPERWVNPDEGAHAMDARLAAEGLIPLVDYKSRPPLYVYAYVPFLRGGAPDYLDARRMPLLATVLGALALCGIGRRLAGWPTGLSAALLYLLSPTVLIDAPVVKTEPLTILLTTLGMAAVVAHLDRGRWWTLALGGVAFGAGYYVRESSLGGVAAAGLVILAHSTPDGWRRTLGRIAVLGAGHAAVCAAVFAFYSRYLPLGRVLGDRWFSPLFFLVESVQGVAGRWTPSAAVAVPAEDPVQSWATILGNVREVMLLNAHLVAALALAVLVWIGLTRRGRAEPGEQRGFVVAVSWAACVAAAYAHYAAAESFYQFYFRELVAPLALSTALLLRRLAGQRRDAGLWLTSAGVAAGLGLTALQRIRPAPSVVYALLLIAAAGWLAFRRPVSAGALARFAGLAVLGTALAISAKNAARLLSPAYDCVWSPETVRTVAGIVRQHSSAGDEVLSGAVIWEFEADRHPFMRISHPLQFEKRVHATWARKVSERLAAAPPRVVVLDGYTERTYLRCFPQLRAALATRYAPAGDPVTGSRHPVQVYVLREPGPPARSPGFRRGGDRR